MVAEPLRYDTDALLCAISGYPRTGCGEQVTTERTPGATSEEHNPQEKSSTEQRDQDSAGSGPSVGLFAGVAAVAVLGAAAVWRARRRGDGS